jgi:hypothetical protein
LPVLFQNLGQARVAGQGWCGLRGGTHSFSDARA